MSKEVLNVIVLPGIVILINLLILLFIEIKNKRRNKNGRKK